MIISIKPWLEMAESMNQGQGKRGVSDGGVALSRDYELEALRLESELRRERNEQPLHFETMSRMDFYHKPVMGQEILHALRPVSGRQVFDGTLGGGGHSEMLLQKGAHVIGCDQDDDALSYASRRLEKFGDCFLPVKGNFARVDSILKDLGIDGVDGMLMDLGVSSHQLDEAARGFSFRADGPLDMRMDQGSDLSAKVIVNEWSQEELADLIWKYGEERKSRQVASAIVKAREESVIETTFQLVEIVSRVIPRVGRKNPATRVFQALRIAVNRELEVLEEGLKNAVEALSEGGVLAVITFHSLEDRIVKHFMRNASAPFLDRPEWPEPRPNPDYCLRLPNRKAIVPSEEEVHTNPRARSAKLRVAVKR